MQYHSKRHWRLLPAGVKACGSQNRFSRSILWLLLFLPLITQGQFKLTGVVLDSLDRKPMPGTNVVIEKQLIGTVTDADGRFEIGSSSESAVVTFSFLGYLTLNRTIHSTKQDTVQLSVDPAMLTTLRDHYLKTRVDLGYYGDKNHAPLGVIMNVALQSAGQASIQLSASAKYWKQNANTGLDVSVGKDLSFKYLPHSVFIGYKSIQYRDAPFELKQTRGLFSYRLPFFFSVDLGAAWNDVQKDGHSPLTRQRLLTGTIGLAKVFTYFSPVRNLGLSASVNYNPHWMSWQAGAYKPMSIGKTIHLVLMAQYYQFDTQKGLLVSLRIPILDTRYYCCYSWAVNSANVNAMK
ncbi:MAG: carboxypeptidase-like regulatory domain-containing protein [Cyclobacteriaceae bacterium]